MEKILQESEFVRRIIVPDVITRDWCNIFGDDINGAKVYLGGLGNANLVDKQWYCPTRSIGRYFMECEHGHKGQVMKLCGKHFREFRTAVTFCPRCNTDDATGHKCKLVLRSVS